jgi:hypothetical protein
MDDFMFTQSRDLRILGAILFAYYLHKYSTSIKRFELDLFYLDAKICSLVISKVSKIFLELSVFHTPSLPMGGGGWGEGVATEIYC